MNEDLNNIQCKECGTPTDLVDNEFAVDGVFKVDNKEHRYYMCRDPLCGAYRLVVK